MNNPEIQVAAEQFASRVLEQTPDQRINTAWSLAYQREPTDAEAERITAFLNSANSIHDERMIWTSACRTLLISNEFFFVD